MAKVRALTMKVCSCCKLKFTVLRWFFWPDYFDNDLRSTRLAFFIKYISSPSVCPALQITPTPSLKKGNTERWERRGWLDSEHSYWGIADPNQSQSRKHGMAHNVAPFKSGTNIMFAMKSWANVWKWKASAQGRFGENTNTTPYSLSHSSLWR